METNPMKRSDLIVGEAYYLARGNDWMEYGGGSRAYVVDTGCWGRTRWGKREPVKVSKGSGVLVDVHGLNGHVYRDVVPTGQLRGLYEPTVALVEEHQEKRRQREREDDDRRAALRGETAQVIERARQMDHIVWAGSEIGMVQMNVRTLADILDLLEMEIE
jgi:hypothetical protein